jgi:hypothetical protein
MFNMTFVKVSDLISSVTKRSGDPRSAEAAYIIQIASQKIPILFGEKSNGHVSVKSYKDGVLVLTVTSSVWSSYVHARQTEILRLMKEFLQRDVVKRIRCINNGSIIK